MNSPESVAANPLTVAAVEVALNEAGELLWADRYPFTRVHGKAETFVHHNLKYEVIASAVTFGQHGGTLVEHVVRLLAREDATPVPLEAVESSQLEAIGHHAETQRLYIRFKGGSLYQYENVPAALFAQLKAAESVGSFFGKNLKAFPDRYAFTKLEGRREGG